MNTQLDLAEEKAFIPLLLLILPWIAEKGNRVYGKSFYLLSVSGRRE